MQLLHALPLLAAAAISSVQGQHDIFSVDPATVKYQDVATSPLYTAISITSLSHANNYANKQIQPICVNDVKRVREAVYNGTRDMYIELNGCSVATPRGACNPATKCQNAPFELHVVGAKKTPGFNPMTAALTGKPVESPYKVVHIGVML